ncbi:MAG: hypothetical protein ACI4L8_00710, partial [Candidatus Fimadaptatus sp.]
AEAPHISASTHAETDAILLKFIASILSLRRAALSRQPPRYFMFSQGATALAVQTYDAPRLENVA